MADRTPLQAPPAAPHVPVVPADELDRRARALAARLEPAGLTGAFLLHPSSFFWLTGTLADGFAYVGADGRAVLAVRNSVDRAVRESPLPQVRLRRPGDLAKALGELGVELAGAIGIEMDVVPAGLVDRLRKLFGTVTFRDVSLPVRLARAVKSPYEVAWVEKAAAIVGEVMDDVLPGRIRVGQTEIELAALLEGELRARRHQGVIRMRRWNQELFYGTVSAGVSACYPCYFDGPDGLEGLYPAVQQGGGERRVAPGEPIMVDYVSATGGYIADRTRIYCVGEPPAEALEAHAFCRRIQDETTARMRPGAVPSEIYAKVFAIVEESPWRDRFMGWAENRVKFLGHGVGLDLDELPVIAPRFEEPLAVGNVVALEPKVFLAGIGGVGVENTFLVTEGEARNLTAGREEIRVVG